MHKYTCIICKKEFERIHKRPYKYCCKKCNGIGSNTQITYSCVYCGELHTRPKAEYERKKQHFCSRNCFIKYKNLNLSISLGRDGYKHIKKTRLHRYIVELSIGRKLKRNEHVHHIDLNPLNNDLNNLQIMSASEHQKLHGSFRKNKVMMKCAICGKEKEYEKNYIKKLSKNYKCMECRIKYAVHKTQQKKYYEKKGVIFNV